MNKKVRNPRQERAIEKKKKIILASYELFSEVGYYGTNTAEIAKKAGVSTGIVYGYFRDKRDILISVLDIYIARVSEPILDFFDGLCAPIDFEILIPKVLDAIIATHKKNAKIHEALHSLTHTDEAVNMQFISLENKITTEITQKLENLGVDLLNVTERVHLAMDMVQSFAHEFIFDKHDYIDYDVMRKMVERLLINLFIQ